MEIPIRHYRVLWLQQKFTLQWFIWKQDFDPSIKKCLKRLIEFLLITFLHFYYVQVKRRLRVNNEGINSGVMDVGDIMVDAANKAQAIVHNNNSYLPKVENFDFLNEFDLLTLHRAENTDDDSRLRAIFEAFSFADRPILFPIHPRTKKIIGEHGIELPELVKLCEPLSYLAMATILNRVSNVITDSGGLQKEAYWVSKPCITLRDETEWVETLEGVPIDW